MIAIPADVFFYLELLEEFAPEQTMGGIPISKHDLILRRVSALTEAQRQKLYQQAAQYMEWKNSVGPRLTQSEKDMYNYTMGTFSSGTLDQIVAE